MFADYLKKFVLDCGNFDDYLEKVGGFKKMFALKKSMQSMV
jgi:hypothetical protein